MKRKLVHHHHPSNLKVVAGFVAGIFMLFLISFSLKAWGLMKQSQFNGQTSFLVKIPLSDSKKKVFNTEVIDFQPDKNQISELSLNAKKNEDLQMLKIPSDTTIEFEDHTAQHQYVSLQTIPSKMKYLFFHYKNIHSSLTLFDLIRLYFYAAGTPKGNVNVKRLTMPQPDSVVDKTLLSLFTDSTLEGENKSIEIINATGREGLGNRLARLITDLGGTVVDVTTAPISANTSEVTYFQNNSYTHQRLSKVLGFKERARNSGDIADVIIVIGKDSLSNLPF